MILTKVKSMIIFNELMKNNGLSKNDLPLKLYFTGNHLILDDVLKQNVQVSTSIKLLDHDELMQCKTPDELFQKIKIEFLLFKSHLIKEPTQFYSKQVSIF